MKKTLVLTMILVAAMFVFTGCEDAVDVPVVPAPAEPTGPSNLEIAELITADWAKSEKVFVPVSPATRANCAPCHDGLVFSTGEFVEDAHVTGIDCQACHTGVGAELIETGVVAPVNFIKEDTEAGMAALCITCHHGRYNGGDALANFEESGNMSFVHYGAPAAFTMGSVKGGVELPGYEYRNAGYHTNIPDNCVACHMPAVDGIAAHGFKFDEATLVAGCANCHGDTITSLDSPKMVDAKTKIDEGLVALRKAILDEVGAVDFTIGRNAALTNFTYMDGSKISAADMTLTPEIFAGLYNYRLINYDPGAYVHNPRYVKALINNTYNAITGEDLGL